MPVDFLGHVRKPLRWGARHLVEDVRLLAAGTLDFTSFVAGYTPKANAVELELRGADGVLKAVRRTHNLRTNLGGDWQAYAMGGSGGNSQSGAVGRTGTATATSSNTLTGSGFNTTGSGLAGHVVVCGSAPMVYGVIVSNITTVLTVDQWYTPGSPGGGPASTPASTVTFLIMPGQQPAWWLALSSDTASPGSTDITLASEITTNGLARAFAGGAGFTHTTVTGSPGQQNTSYALAFTFTATGSLTAVQKCGLFTAQNGGVMAFENTFSSVNMIANDTLTVAWTVNI